MSLVLVCKYNLMMQPVQYFETPKDFFTNHPQGSVNQNSTAAIPKLQHVSLHQGVTRQKMRISVLRTKAFIHSYQLQNFWGVFNIDAGSYINICSMLKHLTCSIK